MRATGIRSSLVSLSRPSLDGPGTGIGTRTRPSRVFYCPSCETWRRRARRSYGTNASTSSSSSVNVSKGILDRPRARETGTGTPGYRAFTTTTTSTSTSTIPPRFRELHAALNRVAETATDRVDLSRLQLAVRGLEAEEPLVRVASIFSPVPLLSGCD